MYENIFISFSRFSNMENVVPVSVQRCEKNYQKSSEQISPLNKLIKIPRRSKNAKKEENFYTQKISIETTYISFL